MSMPRATMRLQFHKAFTFRDATGLVGYLAALGISHLYASPIMTARPGSMHGYDTIDPTRVNPELGGEGDFRRLVDELRRHHMGIIVDIVPNHMAVGSQNRWWMDVLAGGRSSRYAKYFDIDWTPDDPQLRGKVLLPVLGRPYGETLAAGEISLRDDPTHGWSVHYFDNVFPLTAAAAHVAKQASAGVFEPASPAGLARLHELLEEQHYRLAWWRSANDEINWRRFFDINELAAIRVEDDEVFEAVHATVLRLYAQGLIDGVRVDHIDGLAQPGAYCRKLRARLRELEKERPEDAPRGAAYFVVEKILAADEQLPAEWQTDGTTGYDFMDEINALQHDPAGAPALTELWQGVSGRSGDFDDEELLARHEILEASFSAQRGATVHAVYDIGQGDLTTRDISRAAIRRCVSEILVHFPVYRIYARVGHASPSDLAFLTLAVARAKATCLPGDVWLVGKLGAWLAGQRAHADADTLQNIALARFQQLSAPLCAKAVEDTAFYRYGRLISRNDVGFDIRRFAGSAAEFHRGMAARVSHFPHSMLATATHDHKRGEDVRARLAVLSEVASDWRRAVEHWIELGAPHRTTADGKAMPSAADLYILFQTLVGAWPMTLSPADGAGLAAYAKRIAAWQQKALREAKLHSAWSVPNDAYEQAAAHFVTRLFCGPSDLLSEIGAFARRIAPAGAVNGLAQTLVKLTAPGVPDFYQGTEFWDLSLVDPDNRSALDFAARQNSLEGTSLDETLKNWSDGRIKQFIIRRVLAVRKKIPETFAQGAYMPLQVTGPMADHILAFARVSHDATAIIVCPLRPAGILGDADSPSIAHARLKGTRLCLPTTIQGTYADALMSHPGLPLGAEVALEQIFQALPLAFLTKYSA